MGARERGAPFSSEEDQLPKDLCSFRLSFPLQRVSPCSNSASTGSRPLMAPNPIQRCHAGRGYRLPKGNKFNTKVRGRVQGILHSAHSNERAVKGIGHTSDRTPTIRGGLLKRIQIHFRMMFHPFPGVKFRGNLVRRLLRMSEDRKVRNLLKRRDEFAQHRVIQMQRTDSKTKAIRSKQHSNSGQPRHEPGESPPVPAATFSPIALLPTKERGREAFCRARENRKG